MSKHVRYILDNSGEIIHKIRNKSVNITNRKQTDTLAATNLVSSNAAAGNAAEAAARRKELKYDALLARYHFVPVAMETLGPVNKSGSDFIDDIGRRLRALTGDHRERSFLWQRLSVALQQYNAVCFRNTLECPTVLN